MDDRDRVRRLLGREPQGAFVVVVRDDDGDPVVVRNAPFLDDGTPMPTRFYLVGADLVRAVSRLEADGGVRRAEAAVDPDALARAHDAYAAERDADVPDEWAGPRPAGGVGGTRAGVKCLHAHLAYALAGGDDPVGRWTLEHLAPMTGRSHEPDVGSHVLVVDVGDRDVRLGTGDGVGDGVGDWIVLPVGPLTLQEAALDDGDPPPPASLTNALGLVQDHIDDAIIARPDVAEASEVVAVGRHAVVLAAVEIGVGAEGVADGHRLSRAALDEVFRTLALEATADRRHNPGLPADHVESIVATCCVILGIMRRLQLDEVTVGREPSAVAARREGATPER